MKLDPFDRQEFVQFPWLVVSEKEPTPFVWEKFLLTRTVRGAIPAGTITLPGCGNLIAIQRLGLPDIIAGQTWADEQLTDLLQKGSKISDFRVVLECSHEDLYKARVPNKCKPWDSVWALERKYGIPFLICNSPEWAAHVAESILRAWLLAHEGAISTFCKGMGIINKGAAKE